MSVKWEGRVLSCRVPCIITKYGCFIPADCLIWDFEKFVDCTENSWNEFCGYFRYNIKLSAQKLILCCESSSSVTLLVFILSHSCTELKNPCLVLCRVIYDVTKFVVIAALLLNNKYLKIFFGSAKSHGVVLCLW